MKDLIKNIDVNYAVIPCAGRGTRFLPITKGIAKEMCPVIDRPTLDYIIEECLDSGIKNIVLIISKDKEETIKRYYSVDKEFEDELEKANKLKEKELIHSIGTKCHIDYVLQDELLGLGHAVYLAKDIIKDNNFVVCCGDDICTYQKNNPPIKQLIECFKNVNGKCVVGGNEIERKYVNKYGVMDVIKKIDSRTYQLKGIIEKPSIEEAPSNLASLGKWVFPSKIFDYLKNTPKGKGGEIQLTDAIALLMKDEEVYFYDFIGKRYDCGDKLGYLKAIIDIALSRDDLKDGLYEFLKEKVK